jgi:hypothetical protein
VPLFSKRLPHVFPRKDLVTLIAPTYAAAMSVEEEEARDRLTQALAVPEVLDDLYWGISEALHDQQGPRTSEDALMDRLSKAMQERGGKVKAAEAGPALSAVLVRVNLELGLAPEALRATLASDKGSAALDAGLRQLGAHLVKSLLR